VSPSSAFQTRKARTQRCSAALCALKLESIQPQDAKLLVSDRCIADLVQRDGMLSFTGVCVPSTHPDASGAEFDDGHLWYARLCHPSAKMLAQLKRRGLIPNF
jgi:hypothetical protein